MDYFVIELFQTQSPNGGFLILGTTYGTTFPRDLQLFGTHVLPPFSQALRRGSPLGTYPATEQLPPPSSTIAAPAWWLPRY